MMWVSVSFTVTLKDKPKGYLGLTGLTSDTKNEVGLFEAVRGFIGEAQGLYLACYPPELLNRDLDRLAEWAKEARFHSDEHQHDADVPS